jgi:hypothetical protein
MQAGRPHVELTSGARRAVDIAKVPLITARRPAVIWAAKRIGVEQALDQSELAITGSALGLVMASVVTAPVVRL